MIKQFKSAVCLVLAVSVLSSCATVFGGSVNAYQRTKPVPGQQQRRIRAGAMVADIVLFWPGLIVDFATCAIYKPTPAPVPADATQPAAVAVKTR